MPNRESSRTLSRIRGCALLLLAGLWSTATQAQTCPSSQPLALNGVSRAGNVISANLDLDADTVATVTITLPPEAINYNHGFDLATNRTTGQYQIPDGTVDVATHAVTVTATNAGIVDGGTIDFTGRTGSPPSPFGYNNFTTFSVDGSNLTAPTVVSDTVLGRDFLDNFDPGDTLPFATPINTTEREGIGQKFVGDAPAFQVAVGVQPLADGASATMNFSKLNFGPDDNSFQVEGHDFLFDLTGCVAEPGISIEKSGSGPDPLEVGATIDYSFLVTNTGNVTLSDITVTDPLEDLSPIDCPDDTLVPGAEMTCTATYTVTQEDVDAGMIENTGTVTGTPPGNLPPPTDTSTTTFPPDQNPDISIEKSGSGPDPLEVGATIDYSFLVTNTGNVTLSDITVTDPLDGLSPIDCPDDTLAPGAEMTCTATYTVIQDDVDAGVVENTATVTGTPPGNLPPPTDESTTTVPPEQGPGISIEKSGSGPDPLTVGATVDYEFLVANTGNVTLNNVTVEDPLSGLSPISCPETTLAPGAEMTCTATYEVTEADVEAGEIENTATATGEPPGGGPLPTDTSTATFPPIPPVPALPSLAIVLLVALLATATLWTLRRARA